jgi:hypothetical protein
MTKLEELWATYLAASAEQDKAWETVWVTHPARKAYHAAGVAYYEEVDKEQEKPND